MPTYHPVTPATPLPDHLSRQVGPSILIESRKWKRDHEHISPDCTHFCATGHGHRAIIIAPVVRVLRRIRRDLIPRAYQAPLRDLRFIVGDGVC